MPEWVQTLLILLYAYLVGSIPLAYIFGRILKGIDLRKYGSGNVGASNAWVHVGKWLIFPLGLFDIFIKGASPVWLARYGLELGVGVQAGAGLLSVMGHNWSIYLGFTGGRGIATMVGVLFALDQAHPWELIAFTLVASGGWLIFRSSALWIGISILLLPLWATLAGRPAELVLLMGGIVLVTAVKRLVSNPGTAAVEVSLRRRLYYRLLYDRDVVSRDSWVHRRPPEELPRG